METVEGFPATSNDDYQLNLTKFIQWAGRNMAGRRIVSGLEEGAFEYTYGEAHRRVQSFANALRDLGVDPGDRVGTLSWNTHQYFESYFSIPGIGAALLQLNLRLHPELIAYVINHSGPRFLLVDESLLDLAAEVEPHTETLEGFIVVTDRPLSELETELEPLYSYEAMVTDAADRIDWPTIDETSAYGACYTSGTTGKPKGIYYSHRDMYIHTMQYSNTMGLTHEDALLQLVPMFHAQGWGHPYCAAYAGSKLILSGRYTLEENIDDIVRVITDEDITVTNGAPALFMPIVEYLREMENPPDWEGLRLLSGASEPPLDMMKGFNEMTGAEVVHGYGSTECSPIVTANYLKPYLRDELSEEEQWDLKRKQGYVVPGLDVKLVDEQGNEVPHDGESVGEILIRGPWVTSRYHDDPRSEDAFTEEGYWKSGDAATIDEEGYVKITDRIKDVIKSGGEWISSVDMENKIVEHPDVVEACVVGLEHPEWEERPFALVVPREGARETLDPEEIYEVLRERFADWQLPDEIQFVEEVPKTSVGKYDKKNIRDSYEGRYLD